MPSPPNVLRSLDGLVPYPLGAALARLPFTFRVGTAYERYTKLVADYPTWPLAQREEWLTHRLDTVLRAAWKVPFYRWYYSENSRVPRSVQALENWQDVPSVSKEILREWPPKDRQVPGSRGVRISNTGGTTGSPFSFPLDKLSRPCEWAHMHHIWSAAGYRPQDLRLVLRGNNLGGRRWAYRVSNHELVIDTYQHMPSTISELARSRWWDRVDYIHGYPSLVASFLDHCEGAQRFPPNLKGALLGSEYCSGNYSATIESVVPSTVAWWGHSESALLARARRAGEDIFDVLPTYGLAEIGPCEPSSPGPLIATALHNVDAPIVRYVTGDLASSFEPAPLGVSSFRLTGGREAEFVLDAEGVPISLTALIHGRHHAAFAHAAHVQVAQPERGFIEVLVVPRDPHLHELPWNELFDFHGVRLQVSFRTLSEPMRSQSGKASLMVSAE